MDERLRPASCAGAEHRGTSRSAPACNLFAIPGANDVSSFGNADDRISACTISLRANASVQFQQRSQSGLSRDKPVCGKSGGYAWLTRYEILQKGHATGCCGDYCGQSAASRRAWSGYLKIV